MQRPPPQSTLFPYTTLFRSQALEDRVRRIQVHRRLRQERPREPGRVEELHEPRGAAKAERVRSEEHTSELQSLAYLVCRLLLEKKKVFMCILKCIYILSYCL